jgi:hypothetical protein
LAKLLGLVKQLPVLNAELSGPVRQSRRMGCYLIEEPIGLFVPKMDEQRVQKLSQQQLDLIISRLRPSQNTVNLIHLVTKGIVLL